MNNRQIRDLGVPDECINLVLKGIQFASKAKVLRQMNVKQIVKDILSNPSLHQADEYFGEFAKALIEEQNFVKTDPISYKTWGNDIDEGTHAQMRHACSMPVARMAAIMADGHLGYFLNVGGVIGLDNAVCPYAVGVDIACRMKLSILDLPVTSFKKPENLKNALENGTCFGVGVENHHKPYHEVLDKDWTITRITRENKDKASKQLGTSGSGNHFVEFGHVTLPDDSLGVPAGEYVALMSHSGSRGPGAAVCSTYSAIAQSKLPRRYAADFKQGAWLDMNTQEGQEYWVAMNLMGDFAAANHDIIHKIVSKLAGARIIAGVENHHNFAWLEEHAGQKLYVHRKGATPAGLGVMGVIPGSMGTPAFIVRGKGNPDSLNSASHGAGRKMSRTKANEIYSWNATKKNLEAQGIHVLSAGADEVPGAYKDIMEVMAEQTDLVDIVGQFDPKIVKMCGDGSKAED